MNGNGFAPIFWLKTPHDLHGYASCCPVINTLDEVWWSNRPANFTLNQHGKISPITPVSRADSRKWHALNRNFRPKRCIGQFQQQKSDCLRTYQIVQRGLISNRSICLFLFCSLQAIFTTHSIRTDTGFDDRPAAVLRRIWVRVLRTCERQ